MANHEPLPVIFVAKLVQVRQQLANYDAVNADNTLKNDLEGVKTGAAIGVADTAREINAKMAEQRNTIADLPDLDADSRGKLLQVLTVESNWVSVMVRADDYDAEGKSAERAERLNDVQRFSAFLPYYRDKAQRDKFADAIEDFGTGKFADAETKWKEAAGAPAADQAMGAIPAQPQPVVDQALVGRGLGHLLIKHAPLLAQGFTGLALVVVGLFTVYDPETTFRGGDAFLDSVTLFAWGFGSALAGSGISDIAGKLTAGRPSSS